MWIVLGVPLGLVALSLAVQAVCITKILPIFEHRPPFGVESSPPDPDAETMAFPSTHGLTLRGSLYRTVSQPARGLIVFCPEMGGNHWSAMSYAQALSDAGFHVFSFDFRNQGESDHLPGYDPLHWLSEYEVADLRAALTYVRKHPDLRTLPLGLFGISRGGCAALAVAAECDDVKLVACEGLFTTRSMLLHYTLRWASLSVPNWLMKFAPLWHIRITLEMARVASQFRRRCRYTVLERTLPRLRHRPVLMIADGRDTYVPTEIAEQLGRLIGGDKYKVWIVPEAKHNAGRQADPEGYDRRLVELFSEMTADTTSAMT